ncbi:MAG: hypothetical protein IJE40_01485, partial [Clostridia bacterium]|nr:hypothetical protein [Clostridia bacterium]
ARFYDATGSYVYYNCGTDGVAVLYTGLYDDYYYLDGIRQRAYQLVLNTDGNFYFINDGNKIAKNMRIYLGEKFVSGKTLPDGRTLIPGYYTFDADGKMVIEPMKNGVVGDYLYINDVKQTRYKLVEYEGSFYFINDGDKIAKNVRLYLSSNYVNGKVLPDGRAIQPGYYNFSADGKMILEALKNGLIGDYLYINDIKQIRYKLVEYDGNFYFINDGDKVVKNTRLYLSSNFVEGKVLPDGRALIPGYYNFAADGKMIIESLKNGVVGDYLYINDVKQTRYKLVEYSGSFYFINDGDKVVKSTRLYLSSTFVNGKVLPDGRELLPGYYNFAADGKMIIESLKNGVVGDYLYINDVKQTRYKLVEYDGNLYFINDGDKVAKNTRLYLSETFVKGKILPDGREMLPGYYNFAADGKLIVESLKNGIVGDYLYINDVKQTRYKLVEYDGNYYFINDGDKIAKNTRLYLSDRFVANTPIPSGYYNFDANGKLIIS